MPRRHLKALGMTLLVSSLLLGSWCRWRTSRHPGSQRPRAGCGVGPRRRGVARVLAVLAAPATVPVRLPIGVATLLPLMPSEATHKCLHCAPSSCTCPKEVCARGSAAIKGTIRTLGVDLWTCADGHTPGRTRSPRQAQVVVRSASLLSHCAGGPLRIDRRLPGGTRQAGRTCRAHARSRGSDGGGSGLPGLPGLDDRGCERGGHHRDVDGRSFARGVLASSRCQRADREGTSTHRRDVGPQRLDRPRRQGPADRPRVTSPSPAAPIAGIHVARAARRRHPPSCSV